MRVFLEPHDLFSSRDRWKLSKIIKGTSKKSFVLIKPKGYKSRIKIRKNYTDREVVHYVLQDRFHLPPEIIELRDDPVILDLGSNIGLTIVHYKHLYPKASIYGFEMNEENFRLAKYNTKDFADVYLHNQAVWIHNDGVQFALNSDFDSFSIKPESENSLKNSEIISSTTIQKILDDNSLGNVDFLKMDIEGAEEAILDQEDLEWLQSINSLNIEMHFDEGNDKMDHYLNILRDQGFNAWKSKHHWSSILAVRQNVL